MTNLIYTILWGEGAGHERYGLFELMWHQLICFYLEYMYNPAFATYHFHHSKGEKKKMWELMIKKMLIIWIWIRWGKES